MSLAKSLTLASLLMAGCARDVPAITGRVDGYSYEATCEDRYFLFWKTGSTITVSFFDRHNRLQKRLVDQGSGKLDDQVDDRMEFWGPKGHVSYDMLRYTDEDGTTLQYAEVTGKHPFHKYINNPVAIAAWNDAHIRLREMGALYTHVQEQLGHDLDRHIREIASGH